jgi:hypothetical protein
MGWTPYAIGHAHTPLLTTHIDYPGGVNLMWNTAMILPAFVLWPITALFGPIAATNLAITLALPFSGWVTYLLARRYVRSQLAAIVAGLLYAFSPWMISRSNGEIHMTIAIFPPLALFALDEILVRQRRSRWLVGAGLGIAAAAELLTSEEMLALTVMLASLGVAVVAIPHWRLIPARLPYAAQALGAAAVVFLVLAAYPLYVQFLGPLRVQGVLPDPYWTDIWAWIVPTRWQAVQFASSIAHQFMSRNINEEGGAYIGVPLILICLWVTVRFWRRDIVRVASIVAVTASLLAMGDHLHIRGHATHWPLPFRVLEHLPILKNVSPPRFTIFMYLMVVLGLAIFVDWAIGSRPPPRAGEGRGGGVAVRVIGIGATLLDRPLPRRPLSDRHRHHPRVLPRWRRPAHPGGQRGAGGSLLASLHLGRDDVAIRCRHVVPHAGGLCLPSRPHPQPADHGTANRAGCDLRRAGSAGRHPGSRPTDA